MLLVASAKLLAEAEAAMAPGGADAAGDAEGGGAGGGVSVAAARQYEEAAAAAAAAAGGGGGARLPARYLLQGLTQFSAPLAFPDHGAVMEVREAQAALRRLRGARARKEAHRSVRMRLLQVSLLFFSWRVVFG